MSIASFLSKRMIINSVSFLLILSSSARRRATSRGRSLMDHYESFSDVLFRHGPKKNDVARAYVWRRDVKGHPEYFLKTFEENVLKRAHPKDPRDTRPVAVLHKSVNTWHYVYLLHCTLTNFNFVHEPQTLKKTTKKYLHIHIFYIGCSLRLNAEEDIYIHLYIHWTKSFIWTTSLFWKKKKENLSF